MQLQLTKVNLLGKNNVPPSVSKRVRLYVDFPPTLWITHQLVGVVSSTTSLSSSTTSSVFWGGNHLRPMVTNHLHLKSSIKSNQNHATTFDHISYWLLAPNHHHYYATTCHCHLHFTMIFTS